MIQSQKGLSRNQQYLDDDGVRHIAIQNRGYRQRPGEIYLKVNKRDTVALRSDENLMCRGYLCTSTTADLYEVLSASNTTSVFSHKGVGQSQNSRTCSLLRASMGTSQSQQTSQTRLFPIVVPAEDPESGSHWNPLVLSGHRVPVLACHI